MASPVQTEGGIWHRVNGAQSKKAKDREIVSLRRPALLELPSGLESPDSCRSPHEQKVFESTSSSNTPVVLRMHPAADVKPPVKDFINLALSDDLLASVLSCLTNSKDRAAFSQVCKRWCNLEGALHTRIRFPGGKQLAEHVTQALTRFPNLVEVTVDERAVKKSFWRRGNASKGAMETAMRKVAQSCATLEKLNFYSCTALTDKMLQNVVAECPSLRSLRLVRCEKVGKSHKKRFKSGTLEPESKYQSPQIVSPHFVPACANNLVQLNLYGTGVDDTAVAAIGHYCKGLERLSLAGCHDVTDLGLKLLGEGCKRLQVSDFHGQPVSKRERFQPLGVEKKGTMKYAKSTVPLSGNKRWFGKCTGFHMSGGHFSHFCVGISASIMLGLMAMEGDYKLVLRHTMISWR